jgi:hypothetical protein
MKIERVCGMCLAHNRIYFIPDFQKPERVTRCDHCRKQGLLTVEVDYRDPIEQERGY